MFFLLLETTCSSISTSRVYTALSTSSNTDHSGNVSGQFILLTDGGLSNGFLSLHSCDTLVPTICLMDEYIERKK